MQIRELIKRDAKRPTVTHPDRRVSDVLEMMARESLTAIPVVEHGQVLAVLSYGELLVAHKGSKDTLSTYGYVTQDFSRQKSIIETDGFQN